MISKIDYNGYYINSFSLKKQQETSGGYFSSKYISQDMAGGSSDEDINNLVYRIVFELKAYNGEAGQSEDDSNLAYTLNVDFNILFINHNGNNTLPEDFFLENNWYLSKYTKLATKLVVENLLKNTSLEGIALPFS